MAQGLFIFTWETKFNEKIFGKIEVLRITEDKCIETKSKSKGEKIYATRLELSSDRAMGNFVL